MWSSHLWRADPASRCSNNCTSHYSAYRQEERETDRHVVFLGGEHHWRWDCMSTLSWSTQTGETNRWFSSILSSRWSDKVFNTSSGTKVPEKWAHRSTVNKVAVLLLIVPEPIFGAEQLWLTAYWDYMNPNIPNPVITEWAHQSSYYLLLCWHPESITRLLILKELSINGETIMKSIIRERAMFRSCWVDNKGAAISRLPPCPPTTAP